MDKQLAKSWFICGDCKEVVTEAKCHCSINKKKKPEVKGITLGDCILEGFKLGIKLEKQN